jgi:hypothetical protein
VTGSQKYLAGGGKVNGAPPGASNAPEAAVPWRADDEPATMIGEQSCAALAI